MLYLYQVNEISVNYKGNKMSDPNGLKWSECPKCKKCGFTEDTENCVYCGFDIEDAKYQWECLERELDNQSDVEYVNRVAKLKTEARIEEISDKLIIKRK